MPTDMRHGRIGERTCVMRHGYDDDDDRYDPDDDYDIGLLYIDDDDDARFRTVMSTTTATAIVGGSLLAGLIAFPLFGWFGIAATPVALAAGCWTWAYVVENDPSVGVVVDNIDTQRYYTGDNRHVEGNG